MTKPSPWMYTRYNSSHDKYCFRDDPVPKTSQTDEPMLECEEQLEAVHGVVKEGNVEPPESETCSCGNCPEMSDPAEQVCCRSITNWQTEYNSEGNITTLKLNRD